MYIYLKQKVFAIGDKYNFTDVNQNTLYKGKKPALSLTKIYLNDPVDKPLYLIKKKLFRILPKYSIFKDDEMVMDIKKKFSIKPKFEITDKEGNSFRLSGNLIAYSFELYNNDTFLGTVRKKFLSFGDAYELDIDEKAIDPPLFCAIALVIDNCMHDNQNNRTGNVIKLGRR